MSDREPVITYDPIYLKMMDMLRGLGCDHLAVNECDDILVEIMNDLHNLRWEITKLKTSRTSRESNKTNARAGERIFRY